MRLKNGGREFEEIDVRRHPFIGCPVFARDGELFFSEYGDLWRGEIYNDSLGRGPALSAYRYAPLATLETANTSPAEIGVVDIAVTRDTIYLHLYRMGGSGDGWLAQLPRHPAKRDKDGELDVLYLPKDRLPLYKDTLQGLKILRTNSHGSDLCVSPDESQVYYFEHGKHWLIKKNKWKELHIREEQGV